MENKSKNIEITLKTLWQREIALYMLFAAEVSHVCVG